MPIYNYKGKEYSIPEDQVKNFESKRPDATVSVTRAGEVYDLPLAERDSFFSDFNDASYYDPNNENKVDLQGLNNQSIEQSSESTRVQMPDVDRTPMSKTEVPEGWQQDSRYKIGENGQPKGYTMLETEDTVDENGVRHVTPKLVKGADGTDVYRNAMTGEEYNPMSAEGIEMAEQNKMNIPQSEKKRNDPSLIETIGKSLGAGFTRLGAGMIDAMQQLSSGMIVEVGNGEYMRMPSYEETLNNKSNAMTKASDAMHETADRMSAEAQPYGGQKGFLDLLWDGEIGKAAQKGVATAGESLPMTLSAFNPYTMVLNAISMAGGNYREETLENPDVPEWKRATYAIGQAAIEQAVEKYADPVFKYIGGTKVIGRASKDASKEIVDNVTKDATENIAKRIYKFLGGLGKDAAGEGAEEVVTNFGNDILGEALDLLDGDKDYGIRAQWEKLKEENPDASLKDFAMAKAKENVESFIGGAMAGAYTSGTAQLSAKALEYTLGGAPRQNTKMDPVSMDVAQSYDEGMNLEDPNDKNNAKNMLDYQRNQLQNSSIRGVIADALDGKTDAEPLSVLINMIDSGAYTDEEMQLALDFLNAKATYNGMIERVKDNIDEQIHESDITIDARVNRNGSNAGSIVGGTMKLDDRKVYVIDGDVKMFDDGSMVDNANSSESVLVMDAETGKLEFVSPNDILSVDAPIDAEQEKEAARNAIRESVIEEQSAIIDGILPFNPGDEYSLKDEQGNSFAAKVVQSNEDGTVLVSLNGGEPQIMAKEMLQGMSDAENLSRLAEYQAGKTLKETEDQLGNGQQPTTDVDGTKDVSATEQPNTVVVDSTTEQSNTVTEEENGGVEPMPMIGEGDNAEPDFMAVAPERGYKYLYEESGLSQEDVATFVQNNVNEAEKALTKIDGKKPNIGTSISKYNKDMAEWNNSRDAINRKLEYWKKMQSLRNAELQQRAEEQRKKDAEAHDQAVEDLKQYDAEQKRKAEEQAAIGTNAVAPGIKAKWDASTKVEGLEDSIVLPNGETINGRYMLVESGAASASHDANNGFTKTEGFPIDENGGSVNDRDYERDKDAQRTTREIANNYDQRAVQTPVVVSGDGVVLSGNGRTMAGELAAAQNTDGAYIDYVRDHAGKWGFTSGQVSGMQHPRVVFVPADNMPYTSDTFAKFNAQEMKSQSKTEQAVKMGKVVDDATFGRITKRIGEFDTIGDFYADNNATAEVIGELQKAGVVSSAQMAEMFDGDGISNAGKDLIENVLIGKAFESNPDALRQLTEFKSLRQSVMTALSAITDNAKLGEDYSLIEDLAQAIDLAYKARIEGGYNAGDRVSGYARQMNLGFYGEEMTVADVNNIMLLILADAINDSKVSLLKHTIRLWNERAQDAANGQLDLFTGEVPSRDSIINEVKELFKYDSRNEKGPDQTTNADRGSKGSKENGEEVKPVGNSAFGEIFTQFKGNVKAAIAFLLERKQGNAVAALHHPEVGDIDLWYGNDKAGLKKISKKHPEVLDNLQEIIDGMRVVSRTDNRIKLESDTHFAVVSKDWLGEEKDNWLLTAYEKKKKGSSDGTMDIGSEPGQGKQNGTAPLQTPLENEESSSRGEGTNNSATEQENTTENVEVSNVSAEKEGGVDKSKAPWYGTIDEAPATDGLLKSYREELFEEGQSAYSSAYQKYVPMAQFGVEEVKTEPTYEEFVKEYTDRVGDYSAKKVEKYLPAFYEYFKNKLSEATKKNSKKNEPQSTAAEETKTGKDSAKKQPNTVAKSDQKSAVAKEKIEDVGEEIAGARKDIRMKIAKTLENISVKSLVEFPFAKAYKKPDLKKAVEEGALRESDAVFYDAFFNTVVNAQKPHTSKMEDRRRRYGMKTNAEKWAEQTYKSLSVLKEFIEADEARRDEIIKQYTGNQYLDVENDEIILAERKRLNPDTDTRKREWGNKWTPSPLWVTYEVMKRLGYKVGDKLDIPYGIVLPNSSFTGYFISNAKGETTYGIGSVLNIEDAIDKIVWLAKLKRGDADTQNQMEAFYFTPTKKDWEESGRYRVAFGSGMNVKWQEFDSKEEADEFVSKKKNAIYIEPIKTVSRQYGYVIGYRNPLSQERTQVSSLEFETKSEAEEYLQDHYDELNAEANKTLVKDNAEKKEVTADDVVKFGRAYVDGKWVWSVYIDEKYANNMGMIKPLRDFDKKEDAKAYADEVKDSVFKAWKSADEARKNFVYFSQGEDTRVGEDYRGGKDVTAEEFMNTFGFRGVQFGNWTDQADRQMAINQAYDAMMDMANLLGMTPKAMSLNGELGIAFGSRGSGSANAHYELNEVVINLTKTRGAGSLAHEWWHALDNYFARAAGNPLGMVTENGSSEMRAELRNAFQNMLRDVMASNYYKRSKNKGAYWGSIVEVTARLLAEWVNHELKKKGHLNTFLSRGANVDNWIKNVSYPRYLSIHETTGTADEPMSIEEFAETEEALNGFPYPSAKEVERFGDSMRAIFDTIQEREDNGKVVLFQIADVEPYTENNTEAEQLATEAVMTLLNETAGLDVVMNTQEEGQLARQNANAEFMAGIVKAKINALNDASRKILSWLKNNTHNKSFKLELPSSSNRLAEKRIGHKIESHVINANEIIHARKQHGLQGKNNSENSIPLRDEDFALCPYIMASPTRIESGTPQKTGQKSIRYVKEISNGTIVCVEVEGAIEETHMANITMWAEKSPSYTNAMVAGKTASYNTSETAIISSEDAAKIRKDAETAIENDVKSANSADFMTVWHGSAAIFDQFDGAFIGTGEGNQAYGVGHYVSNVRGTGEIYAGVAAGNHALDVFTQKDGLSKAAGAVRSYVHNKGVSVDEAKKLVKKDATDLLELNENTARDILDNLDNINDDNYLTIGLKKQLYEIEIPDDNGKNYLGWEDTVSAEEQRRIENALYDECLKQEPEAFETDQEKDMLRRDIHDAFRFSALTGGSIYGNIISFLGDRREASNLLNSVGYVGFKVQTGAMNGGDGRGMNFVIFNDADLKIKNRIEFLENNGTVYGWSDGNRIHLTPEGINPNTPIHEYTHLWAKAVQKNAPKLWDNVKNLLKGTPIWDEVVNDPAYQGLTNDDEIASEALSRMSGRKNAERMVRMAEQMIEDSKKDGTFVEAKARDLIYRMREAVKKFWQWVGKNLFDIEKFGGVEEVTDRVLYDLVNKTDLQLSENGDAETEFQIVTDQETIDQLEASQKIVGYRNVVLNPDGTFGSPMASGLQTKGKSQAKTSKFEKDKWEQSEEHPELADENGKINLVKPDGKRVDKVDYNPYIHNRPNKVNKQFKQAWERPDLVYIKTEIPVDDLESGYHAEKAAKSVGIHNWPTPSSSQKLILSRYDKPVEIVSWDEVADDWEQEFKKTGVNFDIVPPALLPILAKRGVEILPPHNGMGEECKKAYENFQKSNEPAENSAGTEAGNNANGRTGAEQDLESVNKKFNDELDKYTAEKADSFVFDLGKPSSVLIGAGVADKPMKLYGSKIAKKQKKHGFDVKDLKNLPQAMSTPIAVFDNYGKDGNRSVLTELKTNNGNILVAVDLGKGGDIDFNIISSAFGKDKGNIEDWLSRGLATYIDNKKVQNYLHLAALIAAASDNTGLSSGAKIQPNNELNKYLGEKLYIRTEKFKKWFGDWQKDPKSASKVVDENGEPLVVYHGTQLMEMYIKDGHPYVRNTEKFYTFNDGKGFFTPNKEDAEGFTGGRSSGLYAVYLDIKNPFVYDLKGQDWDLIEGYDNEDGYKYVTTDYIVQDVKRRHPECDGVILKNVGGENSGSIKHPIDDYIPFRSEQIKSATDNNGEFDVENKDIRYRQMDEFEDGQELVIETDKWDFNSPYTIEGLSLPPERNVARLLTSFREKYPQYCAMLNDDQSAIVVTPWAKLLADVRKKNRTSAKAQRERAAYVERKTKIAIDMINEQAQKLGMNVEVKTDTEGLIGRRAKAKGWYDVTTGKIVIVLPNHVDGMDVMRTLMHEGVGHYGMRKMFGKDFDTVLDNIYANSHPSIRRRIAEIAARNGWDFRVATEEYMAGIAEDIDFKRSDSVIQEWWQHIKHSITEFINTKLRELGFVLPFKIDNNDLRLLVWRSYENMANADKHGVLRAAEVEEMKQKTGVGYASDEELERADAAVADDSDPDDDPNGGGIRFRDGEDTEENGTTEEGSTETPEEIEDVPLSLEQSIIHGLNKLAEKNKENIQLRLDAVNAIGGELSKLRKAMSAQKEYDRWTVDEIAGMARVMLKDRWFDKPTIREVIKLLSLIKGATGKIDMSKSAEGLYDMLVENQLKRATELLHNIVKINGGKVNAQGVNVQGQLDTRGQIMMKAFNEAVRNRTKEGILERIAEVEELIGSKDDAIAHNAVIENEALMLALQYISDIKGSIEEETELKTELNDAKAKHKSGEMSLNTYREYVKSVNDALRQNKLERIDSMNKLSARLAGAMRGSIDAAKQFNEREKARVENIHHYANSDLQGVHADAHRNENWRQKLANNSLVRLLFNPLGTFDQMMRMFGRMSVNGEGYLYNHFMRSWVDASDNEFKNYSADCKVLDDKVSEVFGKKMRWSDLYSVERSMPKAQVEFIDQGEKRTEELRQGNLLYIYMANKMADGKMKLRKMGITEEDVAAIKKQLDPRFITLADWLQEDFLKQKRNDFNKVHERMFGAPMDAIENYFPLKILGDARTENVDVSEANIEKELPSVLTGSIIKRRRNSLPLDIMNADAFSVVIEHLQNMEKWAAFAEWRRDLNTLLSYKNFKNKVKNMSSVYGGGENLWHNFMVAGSIAAGTHRPKVDMDSVDTALVNVAKGVTAAKISLRLFTAVKQYLSSPAFMAEADLKELAKSQASPWKSWNWAMENLPTFSKRWESKKAGDNRLMPTNADWEFWKNNIVETLGRWGMSPNAFVDAMTIAIGAKAMYETKLKRYVEDGYTQEVADKKAKQDAAVLFNQTQQSSENAFLSKMQLDRTIGAVAFTVFRNSSFSYTRQYVDAIRELKRMMTPGYKEQSIAFMTKQMVRDGLSEAQAAKAAERAYGREWTRNISRLALFGYVMQFAWNLGPYMPYIIAAMLIGGGDDDEMKKMLEDAAMHATVGSIEGLTAGNVMSELTNMKMQGESMRNYSFNLLPLVSDIQSILTKYDSDKVASINDIVNLVVQAGIGVNPQTIEDAVVAIMDACDNDASTGREAAMLILRLIQAPQSSIDKLYVDELAMNGEDAKNLSVQQMAERYAKYKKHKGAAMTEWLYDEDQERAVEDKYIKRFEDMAKDRLDSTGNLKLDEAYDKYDAESKSFKKMKLDHVNGLKDRDPDKYDDEMDKLEDTEEYEQYMVFKAYDAAFRLYMRLATRTNDVELRDEYLEEAMQIKQEAVIELDMLKSGKDEDRRIVMEKYNILVDALNEQGVEFEL